MAENHWLDGGGDLTVAAGWSLGHVPAAAEDPIFDKVSYTCAGVNWSTINVGTIYFGRGIVSPIGTAAAPLKFGTATKLKVDTPACKSLCLSTGVVTTALIFNTYPADKSFYQVAGTWTKGVVVGGTGLACASGVVLTDVTLGSLLGGSAPIVATFESGVTLTLCELLSGTVQGSCAAVTLNVLGGDYWHKGTSTFDITTLNQRGGRFCWTATGGTITKANCFGGYFDGESSDWLRTLTNMDAYAGASVGLSSRITASNAINDYGAGVRGTQSITRWLTTPGTPI